MLYGDEYEGTVKIRLSIPLWVSRNTVKWMVILGSFWQGLGRGCGRLEVGWILSQTLSPKPLNPMTYRKCCGFWQELAVVVPVVRSLYVGVKRKFHMDGLQNQDYCVLGLYIIL